MNAAGGVDTATRIKLLSSKHGSFLNVSVNVSYVIKYEHIYQRLITPGFSSRS